MDNLKLANMLFPNISLTIDDLEKRYPKRQLKDGEIVTRFSPSPTGIDLHFGHLFACLIARQLVSKNGGVYYLRIEDTDKKREVEGSVSRIIETLNKFSIGFDEGRMADGSDNGEYGPYLQSERVEIYQTVAKELVKKGLAYPCFCSEQELNEIRTCQTNNKEENIGYYGSYAKCRNLTLEEIAENIKNNKKWTLRFKCQAQKGDRTKYHDLIKGDIELDSNLNDVVILKENGIPPYNFAHVCDDHFMRTTIVLRGQEYSSSPTSEHLQLFEACGFDKIQYAQFPHIQKLDNGNKRKLSKSKDPEASVSFYLQKGYPPQAVIEYLMGIANADFESWRKENPFANIYDFDFKLDKMSSSGSLFDFIKLNDVSKEYISRLNANEVTDCVMKWAANYDEELFKIVINDLIYSTKVFNIERVKDKPRKDLVKWEDVKQLYFYMFDEYIKEIDIKEYEFNFDKYNKNSVIEALKVYICDENNYIDVQAWFTGMKEICAQVGFCPDNKIYKLNPSDYSGSISDFCEIIRVALTTKQKSFDLFEIINTLGKEKVAKRINDIILKL